MLTDAQAVSPLHVNRGLVTEALNVFGTFTLTQLARLHTNGSSSSGSWEYAEEDEEAERDEEQEDWYQAGPSKKKNTKKIPKNKKISKFNTNVL